MISPPGNTASSPSTKCLVTPYFTALIPPALVAMQLTIDAAQALAQINLADAELDDALTLLGGLSLVGLDVLPGVCPNLFNVQPGPKDTIDIAVVGAADFDPSRINDSSVSLLRADGVGGMVAPIRLTRGSLGRPADVAGPAAGGTCTCQMAGADGIVDRVFTFSAAEVAAVLELGSAQPKAVVPLKLTGSLLDETPFRATDCLVVVRP